MFSSCHSYAVMVGLDPTIHVFLARGAAETWMVESSPTMTVRARP
jgi:hypothetical protein